MLKRITLNGKRIPVPVPVLDLVAALEWVQKHLMRPDHTITRIQLDGKDIEPGADGQIARLPLQEASELWVKVDSPHEICLQTLDVLRNLSAVIPQNLKVVAVVLWEHKGPKIFPEALPVIEDTLLINELLDSILLLLDKRVDATNLLTLQGQLQRAGRQLKVAHSAADWKSMAKIMLNGIESAALELTVELSSIEKVIFELFADRQADRKRMTR